jgi:phenylpropionate dioxygenase-like ring-hydroxylating dioxygenase large terminal subunit
MTYFGQEMVAWRAQSGSLTVMDAYCEHLGAHLGFGGHVEGDVIECAFHGAVEPRRAQRLHSV